MYAYLAYLAYIANSAYLKYMYFFRDVQADFDPEGIQFKTFPTMARHIVDAMLPKEQGKINKISLHEGSWSMPVFKHFLYNNIIFSAMDGDQLVDFYWINPMLTAERIAAKTKYAGNLYLQFEPEDSWERPGVRAFGRVNGGTVFEAAYLLDKSSVPMLSVFYADKSHLKGTSHHPIYRKYILCILHIVCIFYIFVNMLKQVKHPPHL